MRGIFKEVVLNQRIAFTWQWTTSEVETLVVLAFRETQANQTELTLTHSGFADEEARAAHEGGWGGSLVKLEALYP